MSPSTELLESHLETVIDGLRRTRLGKMQSMVRDPLVSVV